VKESSLTGLVPISFRGLLLSSLLLPDLLAVFLAEPVFEVRRKDGPLFLRATERQILTMLAYKALQPVRMANGKLKAWKLCKPIQHVRTILKSERGRVDAQDNHTVRQVKAPVGSYYEHRMDVCAGYRR